MQLCAKVSCYANNQSCITLLRLEYSSRSKRIKSITLPSAEQRIRIAAVVGEASDTTTGACIDDLGYRSQSTHQCKRNGFYHTWLDAGSVRSPLCILIITYHVVINGQKVEIWLGAVFLVRLNLGPHALA